MYHAGHSCVSSLQPPVTSFGRTACMQRRRLYEHCLSSVVSMLCVSWRTQSCAPDLTWYDHSIDSLHHDRCVSGRHAVYAVAARGGGGGGEAPSGGFQPLYLIPPVDEGQLSVYTGRSMAKILRNNRALPRGLRQYLLWSEMGNNDGWGCATTFVTTFRSRCLVKMKSMRFLRRPLKVRDIPFSRGAEERV